MNHSDPRCAPHSLRGGSIVARARPLSVSDLPASLSVYRPLNLSLSNRVLCQNGESVQVSSDEAPCALFASQSTHFLSCFAAPCESYIMMLSATGASSVRM